MNNETIPVRNTETDQVLDVLVYSKQVDQIEVVLGEGIHSTKCKLLPTANGNAYAGNIMGREIVYERSQQQVQADIDSTRPSTRRR